jgi:hypothetical protein
MALLATKVIVGVPAVTAVVVIVNTTSVAVSPTFRLLGRMVAAAGASALVVVAKQAITAANRKNVFI